MHHVTLHFHCVYHVETDSTSFWARVHKTEVIEDDHISEDVHFDAGELLWERGQADSVLVALGRAVARWEKASGLDVERHRV